MDPEQRYLPPVSTTIIPRPVPEWAQDSTFAGNGLYGQPRNEMKQAFNPELEIQKLIQNKYTLYIGLGIGALFVLKIIMSLGGRS